MAKKVAKAPVKKASGPRRPSVPMEKIMKAIIDGAEANQSSTEVANALGMDPGAFAVRKSLVEKRCKEAGLNLPSLRGARGGKKDVTAIAQSFGQDVFNKLRGLAAGTPIAPEAPAPEAPIDPNSASGSVNVGEGLSEMPVA